MGNLIKYCFLVSLILTACKSSINGSTTSGTGTPTPTATPSGTATPTATPSSSVTPTSTPGPTATPVPTATPFITSGLVMRLEASLASGTAPYASGCGAGGSSWHDLTSFANNAALTFTGSCVGSTDGWQGAGTSVSPYRLSFSNNFTSAVASAAASINDLSTSTFSTWVYRDVNHPGTLLYKSDNDNSAGWMLYLNTPGVYFQATYSGTDLRRAGSITIPTTTWTNVVATWDGTSTHTGAHVYVNGTEITYDVLDVSGTGSHTTDAAQTLRIGNGGTGAGSNLEGSLGGVAVYNRVLSASEVKSNCLSQQASYGVSTCAP